MREALSPTKEMLSRLLATENIHILHQPAETASFNVKDRVLTLPIWKDSLDPDVLDMFIGHEVGHALWTPWEKWSAEFDSIPARDKHAYHSYMNVVEDVRIERKIKAKYPGLKPIFFVAYGKLSEGGFFGVPVADMQKLPFLDRINCHFKIGTRAGITFAKEEMVFIRRIEAMETFEDALAIVRDMWSRAHRNRRKEQQVVKKALELDEDWLKKLLGGEGVDVEIDEDEDEDEKPEPYERPEMFVNPEICPQSPNDPMSDIAEPEEEEEDPITDPNKKDWTGISPTTRNQLEEWSESDEDYSITQEAFDKAAKRLVDRDSLPFKYYNIPNLDPKDWVIPYKVTHAMLVEELRAKTQGGYWSRDEKWFQEYRQNLYHSFMLATKSQVSHLVKEFEMKRMAKRVLRTRVSKTGRLDPDKLAKYKLTENIFFQQNVTPDGQSHGMLMLIDFSGSMSEALRGTLEQTMALVMFCRQAQIPYRVYAFMNNGNVEDMVRAGIRPQEFKDAREEKMPDGMKHSDWWEQRQAKVNEFISAYNDRTEGTLQMNDDEFRLKELLSSEMRIRDFTEAMKNLLMVTNGYHVPSLGLAGTPYLDGVFVLRTIADQFKAKYGFDILNTIFLTDGGHTGAFKVWEDGERKPTNFYNCRLAVVDRKTKSTVYPTRTFDNLQSQVLRLYAQATGSRTMGYYLIPGKAKHILNRQWTRCMTDDPKFNTLDIYAREAEFQRVMRRFQKERFLDMPTNEYHKYFLVPGHSLRITEVKIDPHASNKNDIRKAFAKSQNEKKVARIFLNHFIAAIA
jgi:hypothetical protein